jgi:hypothetical protein
MGDTGDLLRQKSKSAIPNPGYETLDWDLTVLTGR